MQPSDEIKAKLDIVDVIREYIQLKPAGVNFRAPCPFHHEKTPSFIVSPEKQIWHCFGCGKGGDIFGFITEIEGINFVEALRMLAQKAGVQLKKQDPKLVSERNRLLDIMESASSYYHNLLRQSPQAQNARRYLAERGLTDNSISEWQIGYSADSWDELLNFLKKKGYAENEIFSAGLSVKKEGAGRFYDRFRGRIMFPIRDANGAPVAFSARVSPEKEATEKMGKYINSPTTLIYDKSRIIFGLDKAKQEIKSQDLAIVVEGQMDVITAHQHGFKNVVASSGTAFTAQQLNLLKRFSGNIALSFDMDKAGELAAERGIKEALAAEMNIKVIQIPQGKDPDECIRTNPKEWEKATASARPVMEYYFGKTFAGLDLSGTEDRREAAKKLLPILAWLKNKIEQDVWLKKLSEAINVQESILRETLSAQVKKENAPRAEKGEAERPGKTKTAKPREELLSELFLALILKFPQLVEYALNHVQPEQIVGKINRSFYKNIIIYYNMISNYWAQPGENNSLRASFGPLQSGEAGEAGNHPHVSYGEFKLWLENLPADDNDKENTARGDAAGIGNPAEQLKLLDILAILGDENFYGYEPEQAKNEAIKISSILKKYHLLSHMRQIAKEIARDEKEGNKEKIQELMEELKLLTDELGEIGD